MAWCAARVQNRDPGALRGRHRLSLLLPVAGPVVWRRP
ncbi:hypothetical protein V6N12_037140, partial [Hibiscus sabdariffa]